MSFQIEMLFHDFKIHTSASIFLADSWSHILCWWNTIYDLFSQFENWLSEVMIVSVSWCTCTFLVCQRSLLVFFHALSHWLLPWCRWDLVDCAFCLSELFGMASVIMFRFPDYWSHNDAGSFCSLWNQLRIKITDRISDSVCAKIKWQKMIVCQLQTSKWHHSAK